MFFRKLSLKIWQNSQGNTSGRVSFIKKETLAQVFPCKFCQIYETPSVAASGYILIRRKFNVLLQPHVPQIEPILYRKIKQSMLFYDATENEENIRLIWSLDIKLSFLMLLQQDYFLLLPESGESMSFFVPYFLVFRMNTKFYEWSINTKKKYFAFKPVDQSVVLTT